jgi:hypothetical protein
MTSPGGSLTERLQLVVDATTQTAETKFQKLTGAARETGEAAQQSANSVRDAADRVAGARDREASAIGALRVAEIRLNDLREGGRARADQLAAAEEKVATAQRNLALATRNTQRATEEQTQTQQAAVTQTDRAEQSQSRLSRGLDDLKGSAVALGGAGLVALISNFGAGFASAARDAGQLATSMNATTEEAGAFLGLVGTLGLDMNDLLEIQAEFATKTKDGLTLVGTELQHNANGTVNWTNTLVDTLAELQQIPDATERNRLGFAMFGEEGYKQLSRLVTSGVDVKDALAQIGTPFTDEDVAMAAEYDAAMMDLSLTSQRTQRDLGRLLLPVLAGIAEGIGDVIDVVEGLGVPLTVATVAALALGITGFDPAALAGGRLATVMAAVTRQVALYNVAAAIGGRSSALMAGGMTAASAAGGGLMSMLGGPFGVALIAGAGLYTLISNGVDKFRESSKRAAQQLEESKESYTDIQDGVQALARKLADEAGTWDGLAASRRGASNAIEETGGLVGFLDDVTGGTVTTLTSLADRLTGGELAALGFGDEINNARGELGAFASQQETAQITTTALNDLIAEGTTSGAEFATAVRAAAEAEGAQSRTSDLAKAALEAYNATTRDAVQTQLDLFSAQLQQRDGLIGLQQTIYEARDVVDDLSTPWNEVEEATNRVIGSTLSYAGQAADTAVAVARANGTVMDSLTEAQVRGDATVAALRESLNQPGLTDAARAQVQEMITKLEEAKAAGDIEAILRLTGVEETEGDLTDATKDRESRVNVESRGGPAVKAYLDGLANDRLAIIRTESRGGPAVDEYLDGLTRERLAIIRVETRGGPAVDEYLDRLASQARTAYIDVRERAAGPTLRNAPGAAGAQSMAGLMTAAPITIQSLIVQPQVESGGRLTAAGAQVTGRTVVGAIREYTRQNGSGWAQGLLS